MVSEVGWILDVYTEGNKACIWIRTEEGKVVKLGDDYNPSIYILPRSCEDGEHLLSIIQNQESVVEAKWVEKYTSLREGKRRRLIQAAVEDILAYKKMVDALKRMEQVMELYNIDLLHLQQYLFTRLKIEPTSKVIFTHESGKLSEMMKVDDSREIEPPPFTTLHFSVNVKGAPLNPNPRTDPIASIEAWFEEEEAVVEGEEEEVLKGFESIVEEEDPDFLVASNCDRLTLPYLQTRAKTLGLDVQLGREKVKPENLKRPLPYWVRGRVAVDRKCYSFPEGGLGLAGLVERSRFAFLPPGLAARWTANRVNDSRICYELLQRGYVIPKNTGYHEYVRPMKDVFERDRGGMIIPPKAGEVHENVAELDYESEYPNIIVKERISFENMTPNGLERREDAILPLVTRKFLERRLYFKRLRKNLPKDSMEWMWCEQRQNALKTILVCVYGTSGCCWNRFGNVLAFEEINRRSRQTMIITKDYVQSRGFKLIYADTDSVFVKKDGATREEYERLAEQLSNLTGLPISLDHHYKFLTLLPLEEDANMKAQKRYFGILYSGEIVARGIELRRHDTPEFIRKFQAELIKTLLDYKTVEEVYSIGYERTLKLVKKAIDKIMTGKMSLKELAVSKTLRKNVNKYRSIFPHVAAAIQLAHRGKIVKEGEDVSFIYKDSDHHNPLCRTTPLELADANINFDRKKYCEMLLDAAETVLTTFGITRDAYGISNRPRCWLKELREEIRNERMFEVDMKVSDSTT